MSKFFWLPLTISFGTITLLYIIGFIGNVDFLVFFISPSHTEIALLPIAIGLLVGFISERIIKKRS